VILLAAAQHGVLVYSYAPREVKASVAGHGHAGKQQMQLMVRALLSMNETPEPWMPRCLGGGPVPLAGGTVRRRVWAAGSGHISEAARAPLGNRSTGLPNEIDQPAQLVAGCRASYRRDEDFLLRLFLLIALPPWRLAPRSPSRSADAKLTFRRVFKGSSPNFIEITVREDSMPPPMKSASWTRTPGRCHSR